MRIAAYAVLVLSAFIAGCTDPIRIPPPTGPVVPTATPMPILGGDTATPTPTVTPAPNCVPVPYATVGLPGSVSEYDPTTAGWSNDYDVVRDMAGWDAYCTMMQVDPVTNPPPVDLSTQMILYLRKFYPGCYVQTSVTGICKTTGELRATVEINYAGPGVMCPTVVGHWYCVGFAIEQSSIPLVWNTVITGWDPLATMTPVPTP